MVYARLAVALLLCTPVCAAQKPLSAEQVLATAKTEAAAQHKDIFVIFGASWCPPCRMMEKFMETREIHPIFEKYFVVANLNVYEERGKHPELNSPGAEKLVVDYGGESNGVPFLVFLNEQGELIVNSNRPVKGKPKGENVGYPALPEEIDWFMSMLKTTLPSLTTDEARIVEAWLRKHSHD
jgi:thiol-disulfide isomerase/thioredoxin